MIRSSVRRALALLAVAAAPLAAQSTAPAAQDYAAEMRAVHAHDAPVASPAAAAARAAIAEVETSDVVYGTVGGKQLKGWLAQPKGGKKGPAVVVIHEWWGLNDNIKAMAAKLAEAGYTALAVDLFGGQVATTPNVAMGLYQAAMKDVPTGEANVAAAVQYLKAWGATSIGSIGWCFGGHWSLRTGLAGGKDVQAVVMYYGAPITDAKELGRLQAPVLGLFGGADKGIPVEAVMQMQTAAKGLGLAFDVKVYDGADHAFANPSGKAYQKEAAEDSWAKTLAFYKANLK